MPTVQELYELWADEAQLTEALRLSLDPRGVDSLFASFADLGPEALQRARHTLQRGRDFGMGRQVGLVKMPNKPDAQSARAALQPRCVMAGGGVALPGSSGSWPAITSSISALSATVRVSGPT